MDEVTDLLARFPNLEVEELHFIGHSNGTYVVASALEKYRALRVNRVVLAGCVLPRDYRWSALTGRVGQVRNYVGSDDWVVGLCPKLFELPGFKFLNNDIGGAGFDGFTDGSVRESETYFVWGGHGGALETDNVQSIVDFIMLGAISDSPSRHAKVHPPTLAFLSNVCWILWIIGVGVIVAIGWVLPYVVKWVMAKIFRSPAVYPRRVAWICRCAYVAILWLTLNTI
jgi:pimeloyl-ACP methyl ester carboxylesterase